MLISQIDGTISILDIHTKKTIFSKKVKKNEDDSEVNLALSKNTKQFCISTNKDRYFPPSNLYWFSIDNYDTFRLIA